MEKAGRKTRLFHEALKKIYFPPLPSPQHEEPVTKQVETGGLDLFDSSKLDDDGLVKGSNESSPSEDEGADSNKKLTRSQRKRIRKKKLKEAAAASASAPAPAPAPAPVKRRKMIGPLLPTSDVSSCSCEHMQPELNTPQPR